MKLKLFKDFRINTTTCCNEAFQNFIGASSLEDRKKWGDRVWETLIKTYQTIGGIKGSGFSSKEDMIDNIPFWKIYNEGENVLVCVMYKDKNGRKIIAIATNGSAKAKKLLIDIFRNGLKVAWGEKSKAVVSFMMKNIGIDVLRPYLIPTTEVKKLLNGKEVFSLTPQLIAGFSVDDKKIYEKYKNELGEFFYARIIGSEPFLKIALGTPYKTVV